MQFLRALIGIKEAPQLETYRGFGSRHKFTVIGRVTQNYNETDFSARPGFWANFKTLIRRYLAKPIFKAHVEIQFKDQIVETETGKNGFFKHTFTPANFDVPEDSEWIDIIVRLPEYGAEKIAPVLVEGRGNTYGIISDVDDTVLISKATKKLSFLYLVLTKNAHTRTPFNGVEAMYHALISGSDGKSSNPIFYISSSHWNLYEFLIEFMRVNGLPRGPLLLKRFRGLVQMVKQIQNHNHKYEKIHRVLDTYPNLSFILIGDSGQKDTEIYTNIAESLPNRIKAIYIRDVKGTENEMTQTEIADTDTQLVTVQTTKQAARHARKNGFITAKKEAET